jgi:hypothetical protein
VVFVIGESWEKEMAAVRGVWYRKELGGGDGNWP